MCRLITRKKIVLKLRKEVSRKASQLIAAFGATIIVADLYEKVAHVSRGGDS